MPFKLVQQFKNFQDLTIHFPDSSHSIQFVTNYNTAQSLTIPLPAAHSIQPARRHLPFTGQLRLPLDTIQPTKAEHTRTGLRSAFSLCSCYLHCVWVTSLRPDFPWPFHLTVGGLAKFKVIHLFEVLMPSPSCRNTK